MPIHDRLSIVPGLTPGTRYSHAVITTGRLAFVAGQVSLDVDGNLVGAGDLAVQTAQVLHNLGLVLRELGAGWSDVVKLGWYVVDASQVHIIREVRDQVMGSGEGPVPNPASTLIQVSGLVRPEFLVEVDAIVALPE